MLQWCQNSSSLSIFLLCLASFCVQAFSKLQLRWLLATPDLYLPYLAIHKKKMTSFPSYLYTYLKKTLQLGLAWDTCHWSAMIGLSHVSSPACDQGSEPLWKGCSGRTDFHQRKGCWQTKTSCPYYSMLNNLKHLYYPNKPTLGYQQGWGTWFTFFCWYWNFDEKNLRSTNQYTQLFKPTATVC